MSLPTLMYPAYCKRTPCSRATRIQRDLRTLPSMSRRLTRSPQQILQDILTLLKQKSGSMQARVETLETFLEQLPLWTQWDSREDDVVSSAVRDLIVKPSDKNLAVIEKDLGDVLVKENGNIPYLSVRDFDDGRNGQGRFILLYTTWLSNMSSPEQKECHVRDEHGRWVDDNTLRDRLDDGWYLHIPTRTLHRLPHQESRHRLTNLTDLTTHGTASSSQHVSLLDDFRASSAPRPPSPPPSSSSSSSSSALHPRSS